MWTLGEQRNVSSAAEEGEQFEKEEVVAGVKQAGGE